MKKTITLLTLTLLLSVFAFAQQIDRPIDNSRRVSPEMAATPQSSKIAKKPELRKKPKAIKLPATIAAKINRDKTLPAKAPKKAPADEDYFYSFTDGTLGDWTTIDADGDGFDWFVPTGDYSVLEGRDGTHESMVVSQSYINGSGALTPDNYLVSPKVKLGGSITFYAKGQDANWAAEHFGVAVSTSSNTSAADFTTIKEWTATENWTKYTVNLTAYAGQEGYVAIRHFDITDMFMLDVDDITISSTPVEEPTEVTPPADLKTAEWILKAKDIETNNQLTFPVNVGFDGNDVYVQGLCEYLPDAWIKGTRSGDQVVFESGQYLGTYDDDVCYFVGWGVDIGDDVTMTLNADERKLTTEDWIVFARYPDPASENDIHSILYDVSILKPVEKAATPETPTIDEIGHEFFWTYMDATIPLLDTDGEPLVADKTSYQIYYEINHEAQPFVLKAGTDYTELDEDMTIIPWKFTDDWDIYSGSKHRIYLNTDNLDEWNRVGIKSIYTGQGETHESEIAWYTLIHYPSHAVTITETTNGQVTTEEEAYEEGVTVALDVTPDEGYKVKSIEVTDADGNNIPVSKDYTFEMPTSDVTVTATFCVHFKDVTISPRSGAELAAAVATAADGSDVVNLTINLARNGQYTISNTLEVRGSVNINGAYGAKINASALNAPFIKMGTLPTENELPFTGLNSLNDKGALEIDGVKIKDVKITGLKNQLFYCNKQMYLLSELTFDNSILEFCANKKTIFDFNSGGNVQNLTVNNSTLYGKGNTSQKGEFFSTQSGKDIRELKADATRTTTISNSTFYRIAYNQTTSSLRQNGKPYQFYVVTNSIFVDCGKSGQFLMGLNSGSKGISDNWKDISRNTFFHSGANVYKTEQGNIAGTVEATLLTDPAFADPANGDFTIGEETMQALYETGDPRWLVGVTFVQPETPNFEDLDKEIARAKNLMKSYPGLPSIGLEPAHTLQAAIDQAISRVYYNTIESGKRFIIFQGEVPVAIEQLQAAEAAYIAKIVELEKNNGYLILKAAPAGVDVAALTDAIAFAEATLESEESTVEDLLEAYDRLKEAEKAMQAATGIEEVRADEAAADAPAFNLAGQRVNAKAKGIIVKNGKKVLVK